MGIEQQEEVYLGLGANLGDRRQNMLRAQKLLAERGFTIQQASHLYETPPWGLEDQPRFLNQVLRGAFQGGAMELLAAAMAAEAELGRERQITWGPRLIDIDILLFGDMVLHTQRLTVPHPHLAKRAFVLVPLAELAPGLQLPGTSATVQQMLDALPESEKTGIKRFP